MSKKTALYIIPTLLIISAGIIVSFIVFFAPKQPNISNVVPKGDNNMYQYTYLDNDYEFALYLPDSTPSCEGYPLVIMLHGYSGNAESFRLQTHFDENACKRGYVVAYMTCSAGSSTSSTDAGWNSGLGNSDKDDLGLITALAKYLQKEYNCSKDLTFVVGFSNGAFMAQRLAAEANDTFTAVASVAGMMPQSIWEARKDKQDVGVLEIYGTLDDVVPKNADNSAATSVAPAIEDVMNYWVYSNNLTDFSTGELSKKAVLTQYYNDKNDNFVWTVVINDGHHSWPDEKFCGFSVNDLILDFFDQYLK